MNHIYPNKKKKRKEKKVETLPSLKTMIGKDSRNH